MEKRADAFFFREVADKIVKRFSFQSNLVLMIVDSKYFFSQLDTHTHFLKKPSFRSELVDVMS
jgi:hypothetical protein